MRSTSPRFTTASASPRCSGWRAWASSRKASTRRPSIAARPISGPAPDQSQRGLIGKGHPLGGTGVAQVVELVRQLRGEAGVRQIADARVGLAHCRGGKAVGIEGAACTVQILMR